MIYKQFLSKVYCEKRREIKQELQELRGYSHASRTMPEGVLQHTNKHGGMSHNGHRKCPGKRINTSNTRGTTSPREFTISVSDRTPFLSVRSCLCEARFLTVVGIKRKYCVKIN